MESDQRTLKTLESVDDE